MILMRVEELGGKYVELEGGEKMKAKFKYGVSDAGWFPVDSVGFGFNGKDESSAGGGNGQGAQGNGAANSTSGRTSTSRSNGGAQGGANNQGGGGDEEFSQLSISKHVDGATTLLMGFAMEDRTVSKSDEDKMRKVDIHFLDSVMGQLAELEGRFVFPYLMITLDRVLIKGWELSAQGDDRPTESLTLWFDRAAMRYYRTIDGKVWNSVEPKGWDQHANEPWVPSDGEAPYFKQPDH